LWAHWQDWVTYAGPTFDGRFIYRYEASRLLPQDLLQVRLSHPTRELHLA
jgi:hypothetical protein